MGDHCPVAHLPVSVGFTASLGRASGEWAAQQESPRCVELLLGVQERRQGVLPDADYSVAIVVRLQCGFFYSGLTVVFWRMIAERNTRYLYKRVRPGAGCASRPSTATVQSNPLAIPLRLYRIIEKSIRIKLTFVKLSARAAKTSTNMAKSPKDTD